MAYFTSHETKSERQRKPEVQLRNYHSAVKAQLFKSAISASRHPETLLDLAAGRGADCSRYAAFPLSVAVDRDAAAIEELKRRCPAPSVFGVVADILQLEGQDRFRGRFGVVSLMFACHYFCGCLQNLRTLCSVVSEALTPGGVFIGVDIDGQRVKRELSQKPVLEYAGWARLQRLDDAEMLVTITSISQQPKREWFFDWDTFAGVVSEYGLQLVFTKVLLPSASDIAHPGLRAYSGLHRQWLFQKVQT